MFNKMFLDRQPNHVDLEEGEIFLTNIAKTRISEDYASISWETKRLGKHAFDIEGNKLHNVLPVFIKKDELQLNGFQIIK